MYYPDKVFSFRELVPHFTVNYEKLAKDSFKLMFVAHNYTAKNLDIKYVNGVLTLKTKDGYAFSSPKLNSIHTFPSRDSFWVNIGIPFPLDGIAATYDGLVIEVRGHIGKGPAVVADPVPIVEVFDEVFDEVWDETITDEFNGDFDEVWDETIDEITDEFSDDIVNDTNFIVSNTLNKTKGK